jgi:hypothetical protein
MALAKKAKQDVIFQIEIMKKLILADCSHPLFNSIMSKS